MRVLFVGDYGGNCGNVNAKGANETQLQNRQV